jgi:hypothetical protein
VKGNAPYPSPTFTTLHEKEIEETFIHTLKSKSFYCWIDITDLYFVVATSRPAEDKGYRPAGSHEKDPKPDVRR